MIPYDDIPEEGTVGPLPAVLIPPTRSTTKTREYLENVFGSVTEQSIARTAIYRLQLRNKYGAVLHLLETLGSVCGACLVAQVPKPESHSASQCPSLTSLQKEEYKNLRKALHYDGMKSMPCFRCHIPSGGRDEFHPSYGEECPNPHLALPMAYYIWMDSKLRTRAMKDLDIDGKSWEDPISFGRWYATDDAAYFTKSLLLMHWFTTILGFTGS